MQHLYISLGSLSETLSRAIAFLEAGQITNTQFEELDALHYELMLRKRVHIAPDGAFARLLSMKFYKHATPACRQAYGVSSSSGSPVRGIMFIETNNNDRQEAPEERHVNNAI